MELTALKHGSFHNIPGITNVFYGYRHENYGNYSKNARNYLVFPLTLNDYFYTFS